MCHLYCIFLSFTMTITTSRNNLWQNHAFFMWAINHEGIFHWNLNHAFSIGATFKQFKFLSIVFHFLCCIGYICKQPLKGVSWNICSLKLIKRNTLNTKIRTHYIDKEDQHHHLSDVKLLFITCIQKILSRWL